MATKLKSRKTGRKQPRAKAAPSTPSAAEIRPAERQVTIAPAKGRPMLTWVGKHALRHVPAFPAQHIETFDPVGNTAKRSGEPWADWPKKYSKGGLLFHGDNKEVLAHLLANGFRGKVKLIYIDPPFDSGADYVRRVTLRGPSGTAKISGEGYALGEQIQYTDIWANDNYLQFMYERLLLLRELLAEDGSLLLHCDYRKNTHLRCLLDEVFGADNFRNEIVVRRGVKSLQAQFEEIEALSAGNDTIYLYSKGKDTKFGKLEIELPESREGTWNNHWRGSDRPTMRYELLGVTPTHGQWRWGKERSLKAVENYKAFLSVSKKYPSIDAYYLAKKAAGVDLDFIRLSNTGKPEHYVPPSESKLASNLWTDIVAYDVGASYPTQKSEELLERIIGWLTKPGEIVLDSFIGAGTTAVVAQYLGRRWIGVDINKGAIQTTSKRLQTIMQEQIAEAKKRGPQLASTEQDKLQPAQISFAAYRVNDYDLQIQHNEAVNMVCEHIGIERTRADRYFDGVLGKRLVKITPFGHPLTPLDLEELKRELQARPDEERDVVVVCLGKELAVNPWLEEWNRLRKKGDVPNKVEIIELRTDPKYGKFIAHKPSQAKVQIRRAKDTLLVEIQDFISPAIIERLREQAGILAPQIDDWRAMVDSVMIDPDYNGEAFNVVLSDVPEKKTGFVRGKYEMPMLRAGTVVAVKITDMLGEEVVTTHEA